MEVDECCLITSPKNFEKQHLRNVSEESKIKPRIKPKQTRNRKPLDPSKFDFHCHCGKNFSQIKHLNYHRRQVHNEAISTLKPPKKICHLCNFFSNYQNDMMNHYKSSHNMPLVEEKLFFLTEKEFFKWKTNIEAKTDVRFRMNQSPGASRTSTTKYNCNRSGHYGYYHQKGRSKRSLKKRDSIKRNAYCPARIIKQLEADGSCTVKFISAHVGHETSEVHCLHLPTMEKEEIANKAHMNIPSSKILDEIRDSSESEYNLQRNRLLTRKDLDNIEASYKIQSQLVGKHCVSDFNQWSKQMQSEGDCVLFHKPLGTFLEDHNYLSPNDVILILMSASQMDIFKKYGNNHVCIEATKDDLISPDGNNFKLHTLLVLDELEEAFPCAFLISNKLDVYIIQLFFEQIHLKARKIVKPKIFMSGLEDEYFDAWISVMDVPEKRIYSPWILDQTWRENLSRIDCESIQIATYKQLRHLLSKRHATAFHKMLDDFLSIDNPECLDFINYFRDNFADNFEYWAYCYTGLNSSPSLERMCNSISQFYQKGKNDQKLNRGIEAVMRFVRDKVINKLTTNNKHKIRQKIKTIQICHKAMEKMNLITLIQTKDGWEIVTQSEIYQIQKQETICKDCPLICKPCNVCLHQFQCSCLDSTVKYNICKHIHLVARFIQNPIPAEEIVFVVEDDSITTRATTKVDEENNDLEMKKEELIKYVTDMINSCSTHEELNVIREALDQIKQVGQLNNANQILVYR
ncbi:unnamed protein product [Ceutorhynchus assimilis]|uniref:C2H2-type domain-containing protein n=1 Tax=Ceutorhynchus assimilis TaxID=467358 RepID=A0A9N9QEM5_9CUCU|nr:unnamed protein product [Ceutorhynchus assimilis]